MTWPLVRVKSCFKSTYFSPYDSSGVGSAVLIPVGNTTCLKSSFLWLSLERVGKEQKQQVCTHWFPTDLLHYSLIFCFFSICFSFPPVLKNGEKVRANTQLLGRGILLGTRRLRQTAEHSAFNRADESPYLLRAIRKHTEEQISLLCPKITEQRFPVGFRTRQSVPLLL